MAIPEVSITRLIEKFCTTPKLFFDQDLPHISDDELHSLLEHLIFGERYEDVSTLLEQASRCRSMTPKMLFEYAVALGKAGNCQAEAEVYRYLVSAGIHQLGVYVNWARALTDSGGHAEALEVAERTVARWPNESAGYELAGDVHANVEQRLQSEMLYREFVKREWRDAPAEAMELCSLVNLNPIPDDQDEIYSIRELVHSTLTRVLAATPERLGHAAIRCMLSKFSRTYLSYHGLDDRELYELHNQLITKVYGAYQFEPAHLQNKAIVEVGVITTGKYHQALFLEDQLADLEGRSDFRLTYVVINNQAYRGRTGVEVRHLQMDHRNYMDCVRLIQSHDFDLVYIPEVGMSVECQLLAAQRLGRTVFTSWLHPITSGSVSVDYFLSPDLMEPKTKRETHTEVVELTEGVGLNLKRALARHGLANRIQAFQGKRSARKPQQRLNVVCLQRPFKIHPRDDDIFVEMLRRDEIGIVTVIEDSIPLLTTRFLHRVKTKARRDGVDEKTFVQKVVVTPRMSKKDLHAFLELQDMAFDVSNWSGGNTTLDCLFAGLPVMTWPGDLMRQNHTVAIYEFFGIPNRQKLTFDGVDAAQFVSELIEANQSREAIQDLSLEGLLENSSSSPISEWCVRQVQ